MNEKLKIFLKTVGLKFAIIIVSIFIIFKVLISVCYVSGNYMFPNIKDGDLIISWKLSTLQRNDVVIYEAQNTKKVGRVVALEGDNVSFTENGLLKINGAITSEEVFYATENSDGYDENFSYVVPEGCIYILNDYRTGDYKDSRTYKAIELKNVYGSAILQLRRREF